MPFIETVELIAAYHAFVLGVILTFAKGARSLGLFCIVFAAHMIANIGVALQLIPPEADITSAFGLAYGPLMFLFVRELCLENNRLRLWPDLLHFVPPLLIALFRPQDPIPQIIGFPIIVGYCVLIFLLLREHARITRQVRADDDAISLDWIEKVFFAFIAIALLDFSRDAAPNMLPVNDDQALSVVLFSVVILLSWMAWKSVLHTHKKGAVSIEDRGAVQREQPGRGLDKATEETFAKIDAIVRLEELWREPRLTLDNVAQATAHTPREVSRAINVVHQSSFSSYINGFRVDHVDRLMADAATKDRTLLDLSFEAGFNSKSAFNRHYRALRGEPPSKVLERCRAEIDAKNDD